LYNYCMLIEFFFRSNVQHIMTYSKTCHLIYYYTGSTWLFIWTRCECVAMGEMVCYGMIYMVWYCMPSFEYYNDCNIILHKYSTWCKSSPSWYTVHKTKCIHVDRHQYLYDRFTVVVNKDLTMTPWVTT